MGSYTLSRREEEIVSLAIEGLTNDAIAATLNLSVGTVNTYWSRVRLKVGGVARTDTVAKIIADRSEERKRDRAALPAMFPEMDSMTLEMRAVLPLFQLAKEEASSAVWAIEKDMTIRCFAVVNMPPGRNCSTLGVGKSVFEVFGSTDEQEPAIAAHLNALNGQETTVSLDGAYDGMRLRTVPLLDEEDACIGCIGVLSRS
jgi:DNA-binding CsgD family transcriptional regulator